MTRREKIEAVAKTVTVAFYNMTLEQLKEAPDDILDKLYRDRPVDVKDDGEIVWRNLDEENKIIDEKSEEHDETVAKEFNDIIKNY